jgi:hypothetical protein
VSYVPAGDRYEGMPYRRAGRSGLLLPAISLGLWHNFGDEDDPFRTIMNDGRTAQLRWGTGAFTGAHLRQDDLLACK